MEGLRRDSRLRLPAQRRARRARGLPPLLPATQRGLRPPGAPFGKGEPEPCPRSGRLSGACRGGSAPECLGSPVTPRWAFFFSSLISDTLKRFAVKVTTASVKERREILSELGKCISGKDLPEGAVKGLCKLFCLTLHRYRDAASRRALQLALQQLAESQPDATAKNLLQSLQSSGIGSKAGVPSKSSGSAALLALSWTCLLVRTVFPTPEKRQGETWKKLVEVQCLLLLEVLGGSHKQAVDGAVKKLNRLWKENQDLVDQYLSVILGLEPNQSYAAMLGLVVQFCTAQKEIDIVKRYKVNLLYCFFGGISSVTSHHGEGG
ncbi:PREDICTED: translational activator GCN1-like [Haliaeetus leucocephalus]|uniref:translational activator GCN1-like n=1 Tax=Haliaeetus leucocephalus TaxID=52644 RepID=UPI00053CD623|nr:PREDICTED: translational activator GCN1-like [Haliaeetus leucocephalus]